MQSISLNLEAAQFLAGWRPENGHLFLPALSDSRIGEEVAARLGIVGQEIRATVFGKVAVIRRVGRPVLPPGIEIALDPASLPAAKFLAMAARGEAVNFRERAARYVVERNITVVHAGISVETTTLNVSEGGCALRWPAQVPAAGEVVSIRLGRGFLSPALRAVLCWSLPVGPAASVGLRVLLGGRARRAWRSLVDEAVRSGARAA